MIEGASLIRCAVCHRPVEEVQIFMNMKKMTLVQMVFCHGESERREVAREDIANFGPAEIVGAIEAFSVAPDLRGG